MVQAIAVLDVPIPQHDYCPIMNSWARSLCSACSFRWARCLKWSRIEDNLEGRAVVASSWSKAAWGLVADEAARLPSRWDQVRACCVIVSLSLGKFMAPAFAEVGRKWSSSLVPGTWPLAQGQAGPGPAVALPASIWLSQAGLAVLTRSETDHGAGTCPEGPPAEGEAVPSRCLARLLNQGSRHGVARGCRLPPG